jgi:hypothetical protein
MAAGWVLWLRGWWPSRPRKPRDGPGYEIIIA